jgi:hypothetical protein
MLNPMKLFDAAIDWTHVKVGAMSSLQRKLTVLGIVCAALVVAQVNHEHRLFAADSDGVPTDAANACITLLSGKRGNPPPGYAWPNQYRVVNSWWKNNRQVLEIERTHGGSSYGTRLCVISSDHVSVPSVGDEDLWRND